jgi:hypothetical protein
MVNAAHRRERRLDQTVRERRVGRHFVHRLIGLEARIGLAFSTQFVEPIASQGEAPSRAFGPNKNTTGKPGGMLGEDQ